MLNRLAKVSQRLLFIRPWLGIVALVTLSCSLAILFMSESQQQDKYLLPSFTAALWFAMSWLALQVFPYLPTQPLPEKGLWRRFKHRVSRLFAGVFACALLCLGIVVCMLVLRLLGVWFKIFV